MGFLRKDFADSNEYKNLVNEFNGLIGDYNKVVKALKELDEEHKKLFKAIGVLNANYHKLYEKLSTDSIVNEACREITKTVIPKVLDKEQRQKYKELVTPIMESADMNAYAKSQELRDERGDYVKHHYEVVLEPKKKTKK